MKTELLESQKKGVGLDKIKDKLQRKWLLNRVVCWDEDPLDGKSVDSETDLEKNQDEIDGGESGESCLDNKIVQKRFPILKWWKDYNSSNLVADVIAGLTIGLTILPQGLAYARIAGLPPQYGLYSGFVGCFVYIFLGGSKVVTIGPTAVMGIITLTYTEGMPVGYAVLLSFLTGIVTFIAGMLRLGFITNFISTPVISAFTSSAALTICSTQIKPLLGLKFKGQGFRDVLIGTFQHIKEINRNDATLSFICIVFLLSMQKIQCKCLTKGSTRRERILWFFQTSRNILLLFLCTVIFSILDPTFFPVEVVGEITPGLPNVLIPGFDICQNATACPENEPSITEFLKENYSALIVLPLLALMEHITAAKKFSGTDIVDSSQEMVAIGVTNIIGSFFSSMPVTGSFSRTTVNAASGAQSPLGGLITGILVLVSLQFLLPFFYYIPNASLASVVICAVIFTVDFTIVKEMWNSKRYDLIPWGITFFMSLFGSLEIGILCGIVVSIIFLLFYAARPSVRLRKAETSGGNEFVIIALDRSIVFPSTEYIRYVVTKSRTAWAKGCLPIVLDCHHIQYADFSAAKEIRGLFSTFQANKHSLILWRAKPSIMRILTGLKADSELRHCSTEEELEKMIDSDVGEVECKFSTSLEIFINK